jgi:hypothetical protein
MLREFSVVGFMLLGAPALAQNPQSTSPINPTSPANPTVPVPLRDAPTAPPERIVPPHADMSDQLSQRKGTITPPNVDPGMMVKPPDNGAGTTPVIPPPGSPGGNPSVVPK